MMACVLQDVVEDVGKMTFLVTFLHAEPLGIVIGAMTARKVETMRKAASVSQDKKSSRGI
jgi:hypothetical protein